MSPKVWQKGAKAQPYCQHFQAVDMKVTFLLRPGAEAGFPSHSAPNLSWWRLSRLPSFCRSCPGARPVSSTASPSKGPELQRKDKRAMHFVKCWVLGTAQKEGSWVDKPLPRRRISRTTFGGGLFGSKSRRLSDPAKRTVLWAYLREDLFRCDLSELPF